MTLTGPPGVGKSRLALETARSLEHEFPDGVWLVDFARAGGADDAVRLLAHAVDVRGSDPLARVTSRLRDAARSSFSTRASTSSTRQRGSPRRSSRSVPRCGSWRRAARRFTSRAKCGSPVAPLGRRAAVELFLERARAARPGFEPDAEAVALAAEIVRRVDGLPLAIELAAARVNVLGLAELVSILERRAALLRDSPASDPSPHRAARARRMELRPLARGREDAAPAARRPPRRRVPRRRSSRSAATHGLNEATVAYLVAALVDKSIVSASFSGGVARYDMLDTVREYVLERLAESGGLAAARGAHAEYFAALADEARVELRGPEWLHWERRLELENDNLWAALAYARDAPDPARRGPARHAWGGTSRWPSASPRDGASSISRSLPTRDDAPVELRIELLADLCYLATEELDLERRARGRRTRRSRSPRPLRAPWQRGLRAADARARPRRKPGVVERAPRSPRTRAAAFEAAGDGWGVAASSLIRAIGARARRRRLRPSPRWPPAVRRHSDAIGYDAFRVPGAAARGVGRGAARGQRGGGRRPTGARSSSPERSGSATTRRSRSPGSARTRSRTAICGEAEELQRQALADAEAAHATWVAPTRASSSRASLRRPEMPPTAERLYRQVLEWSQTQRPHQARESLFVALAGSPAHGSTARARRARRAAPRHRAHLSWQKRRRAWQSVGIGADEPSCCQRTDEQEARHEHNHDRGPARGGPPPDRPAAGARAGRRRRGESADPSVTSTHCTRRRHPSRPRRATAPDEVEEKLGQLKTRLAVAEHSLVATSPTSGRRSPPPSRTSSAAGTPTSSGCRRPPRRRRGRRASRPRRRSPTSAPAGSRSTTRLAQAREDVDGAWHEQRNRVSAARDELEQKADELSAKLN